MDDVLRAFGKSGSALLGLGLVAAVALAAVVAPALAPHDPDAIDAPRRLARPFTTGHVLGTDEFGRDLLSRLLHGARISLPSGSPRPPSLRWRARCAGSSRDSSAAGLIRPSCAASTS
jgi:peptide/nickel transport system permease protein